MVETARKALADPGRAVEDDRAVVLAVGQTLATALLAPGYHSRRGTDRTARGKLEGDHDVGVVVVRAPGATRRGLVAVDGHLHLGKQLEPVASPQAGELAGAHRERDPRLRARPAGDRDRLAQLRMGTGRVRVDGARGGICGGGGERERGGQQPGNPGQACGQGFRSSRDRSSSPSSRPR
jgi:hypothetical protein